MVSAVCTLCQMFINGRDFIRQMFAYPEIELAASASNVNILANDLLRHIQIFNAVFPQDVRWQLACLRRSCKKFLGCWAGVTDDC